MRLLDTPKSTPANPRTLPPMKKPDKSAPTALPLYETLVVKLPQLPPKVLPPPLQI